MAGTASDLFSYLCCLGLVLNGTTTATVNPCSPGHTALIFMRCIRIVL
jgi:hypothetical protein